MTDPMSPDELMAGVAEMQERGEAAPRLALDAVNGPMIRHWVEAIGDADPRYAGADPVAPPAMAQVWTMFGLDPHRPDGDPLHGTMKLLDEAGYTSVLGTDCDQTYARFLRSGERVAITSRLESVVGPKATAVGEGYFVTTMNTWWVAHPDGHREPVATMTFRVLKFRPGSRPAAVDKTKTVRPARNRDNDFFFEGTAVGELRIQQCNACKELRHPPGPVCPSCHAMDRGYVVASGRGRVFSWLVHHAPAVPGKQLPLPIALVELEEGVRMVGAIAGDTTGLEIGSPVEVVFERIDDGLTLASWRLVGEEVSTALDQPESVDQQGVSTALDQREVSTALVLPTWELPITPTLVVSTALATRDFQDVHHDRDLAVQRGSKDIFLNILATTGFVQRYVGEWARASYGPDVRITACALRLGAPAYPYDTLSFTGDVVSDDGTELVVDVVGAVLLGNHVNARVTFVRERQQ
jgi:uncharacterized OB-fold protein